jgi:hypothetical protein
MQAKATISEPAQPSIMAGDTRDPAGAGAEQGVNRYEAFCPEPAQTSPEFSVLLGMFNFEQSECAIDLNEVSATFKKIFWSGDGNRTHDIQLEALLV